MAEICADNAHDYAEFSGRSVMTRVISRKWICTVACRDCHCTGRVIRGGRPVECPACKGKGSFEIGDQALSGSGTLVPPNECSHCGSDGPGHYLCPGCVAWVCGDCWVGHWGCCFKCIPKYDQAGSR